MPLTVITPIDRAQDAAAKQPRIANCHRKAMRLLADGCYIFLKGCAFTATNFMIMLGLPLLFFLAISGGDLTNFFMMLELLASRFLDADSARQMAFVGDIQSALVVTLTLIAVLRTPKFVADVANALAPKEQ